MLNGYFLPLLSLHRKYDFLFYVPVRSKIKDTVSTTRTTGASLVNLRELNKYIFTIIGRQGVYDRLVTTDELKVI